MDQLRLLCNQLFGGPSPSSAAVVRDCSPATAYSLLIPPSSTVTAGPGLFPSIGNKTHDLLWTGFQVEKKLSLTTCAKGIVITSSCKNQKDAVMCDIIARIKYFNVGVDLEATSNSALSITTRSQGLAVAGLKSICTIHFDNLGASKAELQYLHDYAGICAGITLSMHPKMNVSALFGTRTFALGADMDYDTEAGSFTKCNVGMSLNIDGLFSSLLLSNEGDNLTASVYHLVNKEKMVAVGSEITHRFSSKNTTLTTGLQYSLDDQTSMKLRHTNEGIASILFQHKWKENSVWTLSAEIDTKAIKKSPKVGLSLILKP